MDLHESCDVKISSSSQIWLKSGLFPAKLRALSSINVGADVLFGYRNTRQFQNWCAALSKVYRTENLHLAGLKCLLARRNHKLWNQAASVEANSPTSTTQ